MAAACSAAAATNSHGADAASETPRNIPKTAGANA
ncbi:Uncharacterised protein [Bordetella pertussis]|nr:Uncharacterised protein [Bordetella pertussis]CPI48937.1 Uncharacterised protein [Bordetella pertussis]